MYIISNCINQIHQFCNQDITDCLDCPKILKARLYSLLGQNCRDFSQFEIG